MTEKVVHKWFWVKFWFIAILIFLAVDYVNGLGNVVAYHSGKTSECMHYSLVRFPLHAALVDIEGFGKARVYTRECEEGQLLKIQQRKGILFCNQIFELRKNA